MKAPFTSLILLFLVFASVQTLAQTGSTNPDRKRTQIWYFGKNAGLDFSVEPPMVLVNTATTMNAAEGCATMCDAAGNILFYSNGEKVWNRFHKVMPNGSDLKGNYSSTQSALIIPYPNHPGMFYLFTTDRVAQPKGLQYSIIDMHLDNDSGDVTQIKNIPLLSATCEKVTATRHANGRDIWVLAHGWENNNFYAWLITPSGLIECPVISSIGSIHGTLITNAQGMMMFSPSGKYVALNKYTFNVEGFIFNNATGELTDTAFMLDNIFIPYGIAFSPDERYLYVTDRGKGLFQYNITLGDSAAINDSRDTIYQTNVEVTGGMQLGSDGKLYVAMYDSNYVGVINKPNLSGTSADWQPNGIMLGSVKSQYGLPNYISSYFYNPAIDFRYNLDCVQDTGRFYGSDTNTVSQWDWRVRHLSNGSINTYSTQDIIHLFSDTGRYEVRLIATHGTGSDTAIKILTITKPPRLNLGTDKTICQGDSLVLDIGNSFRCFTWEDNSQVNRRVLKTAGTYFIETVNENFCMEHDTVQLTIQPLPAIPTITRSNDTLYGSEAYSYQWYRNGNGITSATNPFLKLTQNGSFQVAIADSVGCTNISDPVDINDLSVKTPTQAKIQVYPNPASQSVNVEIPSINSFKRLSFYNLLGQSFEVPFHVQNSSITADIYALPVGMYMLRIDLENEVIYTKIIVESNQP